MFTINSLQSIYNETEKNGYGETNKVDIVLSLLKPDRANLWKCLHQSWTLGFPF